MPTITNPNNNTMHLRKIGPVYTATLRLTARPGVMYYGSAKSAIEAIRAAFLSAAGDN